MKNKTIKALELEIQSLDVLIKDLRNTIDQKNDTLMKLQNSYNALKSGVESFYGKFPNDEKPIDTKLLSATLKEKDENLEAFRRIALNVSGYLYKNSFSAEYIPE